MSRTASPTRGGGRSSAAAGLITLCLFVHPVVAYGACPEVDLGSALPVTYSGTTTGSINAFFGSCGGGGASAPEQTFVWTAPASDTYRIDTFGSAFDTILYVRSGSCDGPEVVCNDDVIPLMTLQSQVLAPLDAGQTVVLFVDGFGGQSGAFELHINSSSAPTFTPVVTASATQTPTSTPPPTQTPSPTPSPTANFGISGHIRYYSNAQPVPAVSILLDGLAVTQTDDAGAHAANGLAPTNWDLRPTKSGDIGSSVSALDASFILQALLGVRTLTPEQRLAGDVTGNGTLSALDASRILQFKLGIIATLPVAQMCASDWVFIPTPAPVPHQEVVAPAIAAGCQMGEIRYAPLDGSAADQDFAAAVFGDVTGNWQPPPTPTPPGGSGSALAPLTAASIRSSALRRNRHNGLDLPLAVQAAGRYYAAEIELAYDPSQLRALRVRRLAGARGALLAANLQPPGRVRIALASGRPLDPDGTASLLVQFAPIGPRSVSSAVHVVGGTIDAQAAPLTDE
jgi:hypothetical protein